MRNILSRYGIDEKDCKIKPLGNGLINKTWLISNPMGNYVLQRINDDIFKSPQDIDDNINQVAAYLQQNDPGYLFVVPLPTTEGKTMLETADGFYRLFPFISGSHTIDVVEKPEQAYEAAKQFGKFTRLLANFDAVKLKITLPGFHDLSLRYQQFQQSLAEGNAERIRDSDELIQYLLTQRTIVNEFELQKKYFKLRVTHHDTKISNILFDENDKGLFVIDLDTLMPGYFISDLGDMMRTYLCPVSEEEADFSKIIIRKEFYQAIADGYNSEMEGELTETEKKNFLYAGKFMIYMQAIRFLTDHLNNDIYYGSRYEGHNLVRAGNQATLLQRLIAFESEQATA